jgi:hypothetical protein
MNKDDIVFYFICFGFLFMITAFLSVRGLIPLSFGINLLLVISMVMVVLIHKGGSL